MSRLLAAALSVAAGLVALALVAGDALRARDVVAIDYVPGFAWVLLPRVDGNSGRVPLRRIARFIPDPLPPAIPQTPPQHGITPENCPHGALWLQLRLAGGRTVRYGPCLRPLSIDRLVVSIGCAFRFHRASSARIDRCVDTAMVRVRAWHRASPA